MCVHMEAFRSVFGGYIAGLQNSSEVLECNMISVLVSV